MRCVDDCVCLSCSGHPVTRSRLRQGLCRDCPRDGVHERDGRRYCADCFQVRFGTWPEVSS